MAVYGQERILVRGIPANEDLTGKKFYVVELDGTNQRLQPVGTAGNPAIGVLQDEPDAAGVVGEVIVVGGTKVQAGGNITFGDILTATAAGKVVVHATDTHYVIGRAMEDGADGEIINIYVDCGLPWRPATS